eukprot:GFKZ01012112.1.p1 GENE.GFKZ01012112.1~~GFKZ01012112.1.p1  ORF type:complete len:324 (-),score=63.01 GFKZ01012112.1:808-1671(-)
MGRKRSHGNSSGSSSDDDFHPGSAESTEKMSRLKRKRRQRSSVRGKSGSDYESKDRNGIETELLSVPEVSEGEQEENVAIEQAEQGREVSDSDQDGQNDASIERTGRDESAGEEEHSNEEDEVESQRRAARVRVSKSDEEVSDGESVEDDGDNDEDYNSADSSPDENDDEESDFAPSPVKAKRKRKNTAGVSAATKARRKVRGRSNSDLGERNFAQGRGGTAAGKLEGGGGRKTLGAKIRRLSSLSKSAIARGGNVSRGESGGRSHTVYRAGLSRHSAIPRLHAYLK